MGEAIAIGKMITGFIALVYWGLAASCLYLAVFRPKGIGNKTAWSLVVVAAFGFLPGMAAYQDWQQQKYREAAWAYFKNKCATEAGEKIYKTFTGVKSVLVIKPLPPATDRDHFDQFWYGDPYSASATSDRGTYSATRLAMNWRHRSGTGSQKGLDFVEIKNTSGEGYTRIRRPEPNNKLSVKEQIQKPVSRFGVAWDDISTPEDRKYWVAGSRFRVIDLADNSVVAERIGYLIEAGFGLTAGQRRPWLTARGIGPNGRSCPDAHDATDQWFITSVFKQKEGE